MIIFTMGFTQKNAEMFFELIKKNEIELLIDVRLNNKSQLAGFTKGQDLAYFLNEICGCKYEHEMSFAPTKDILDRYKKKLITWSQYENEFNELITSRKIERVFEKNYLGYDKVLLLCSEPTSEFCHRRLVAEYLKKHIKDVIIKHL